MSESEVPPIRVGIRLAVSYREARFQQAVVTIGRSTPGQGNAPHVDLSQDESVSRQHAEIRWTAAGYTVVDLGSTNGTRLNGRKLEPNTPAPLSDGDRIAVGRLCVLTVSTVDSADAGSSASA